MKNADYQVSIGRIRLKPNASRLRFLRHTVFAYLQAKRSSGSLRVSVRGEDAVTYWSLSVWASREAMLRYRNSGSHRRAMKASRELAERVDFCHWTAEAIPTWREALNEFAQRVQSQ